MHKSVPSKRVKAFFQEGFEKSSEKGRSTDRMLDDRESITHTVCLVVFLNSMLVKRLSINFFFLNKIISFLIIHFVQSRDIQLAITAEKLLETDASLGSV